MKTDLALTIQIFAPNAAPGWARELALIMPDYGITTPGRMSMFLAQCAHESRGLTRFEENLNYSAEGLMRTWPKRFPTATAAGTYARNPEAIANHVYANRLGNGNEESGDGWKYRGRGAIQITGASNYISATVQLNHDFFGAPEDLLRPELGALAACWFWERHNLNAAADRDDFRATTLAINGGSIGAEDRQSWLDKARGLLA